MSIASDIAAFNAKLDATIDSVMQGEVAEGAKKALRATAYSEVYAAYSPAFMSRRMDSGGLADVGQMEATYGDKTLTIQDMASWQQLYGGSAPGGRLAEAIASGDSRYHFDKAGPRPFHEEAEREFSASGEFENLLVAGLRAAGFKIL